MLTFLNMVKFYKILFRLVNNFSLKELWEVDYDTEDDDRNNIDDDPPEDTAGFGEITIGVWVTHRTVPGLDLSNLLYTVSLKGLHFYWEWGRGDISPDTSISF